MDLIVCPRSWQPTLNICHIRAVPSKTGRMFISRILALIVACDVYVIRQFRESPAAH